VNIYHTKMLGPLICQLVEYDSSKLEFWLFWCSKFLDFKEPVERLMRIFSKSFTSYALFDKPKEYGIVLKWVFLIEYIELLQTA
jgi:hypothetical protein